MFIETSKPRQLGDEAVLQSKLYPPPTHGRCLQFYYHMYGEHMGTLKVLFSPRDGGPETVLWEKSQDLGNQWLLARAQIPRGISQYRVGFGGEQVNCEKGKAMCSIGINCFSLVGSVKLSVFPNFVNYFFFWSTFSNAFKLGRNV